MRQTNINAIIHSSVTFKRGLFIIFVKIKKKLLWIKFLISLLFFLIRSPAMSWSILQKVIKIFIELFWKLILPKTDMYRDCSFVVYFPRKGYCWNVFRIHLVWVSTIVISFSLSWDFYVVSDVRVDSTFMHSFLLWGISKEYPLTQQKSLHITMSIYSMLIWTSSLCVYQIRVIWFHLDIHDDMVIGVMFVNNLGSVKNEFKTWTERNEEILCLFDPNVEYFPRFRL